MRIIYCGRVPVRGSPHEYYLGLVIPPGAVLRSRRAFSSYGLPLGGIVAGHPKFIFHADLGRSPSWAFPITVDIFFCVVLWPSSVNLARVVRIIVPFAVASFQDAANSQRIVTV
jgi:hypothetical protein